MANKQRHRIQVSIKRCKVSSQSSLVQIISYQTDPKLKARNQGHPISLQGQYLFLCRYILPLLGPTWSLQSKDIGSDIYVPHFSSTEFYPIDLSPYQHLLFLIVFCVHQSVWLVHYGVRCFQQMLQRFSGVHLRGSLI